MSDSDAAIARATRVPKGRAMEKSDMLSFLFFEWRRRTARSPANNERVTRALERSG